MCVKKGTWNLALGMHDPGEDAWKECEHPILFAPLTVCDKTPTNLCVWLLSLTRHIIKIHCFPRGKEDRFLVKRLRELAPNSNALGNGRIIAVEHAVWRLLSTTAARMVRNVVVVTQRRPGLWVIRGISSHMGFRADHW